jgi:hypothetical protein
MTPRQTIVGDSLRPEGRGDPPAPALFYARIVHRWDEARLAVLTRYFSPLAARPFVARVIHERAPTGPCSRCPGPSTRASGLPFPELAVVGDGTPRKIRQTGERMRAQKATITVHRPQEEVQRLWTSSEYRQQSIEDTDASVSFTAAPGDRGTEIHVDLRRGARGGKLGEAVQKLTGTEPLAKVKDDLRRFKQLAETGVISRSEALPGGESIERKLKQRPAQPLSDSERDKAGVS